MNVFRYTAAGTEQITWLQAVLALAHESRLTIDEASAALRSGLCRTFSSLYSTENDMNADLHALKKIADRLIKEGHLSEVILAARYGCLRAWSLCCEAPIPAYPAPTPAVAELFEAVAACEEPEQLEELHAFVEDDYVNWGAPVSVAA